MKKIVLFIFLCLPLFANIDAQIEAIQRAPVAERFKLMNAFKKEIVQMQEKERINAMSKLQSITQSKHAHKAFRELRTRTRVHQAKGHIRREQHLRPDVEHEDETEDSVENEAEEQAENETEDSVENEVEEQTENETEDSVENETEEHVEQENEEHIENETEDHEEDEHDDD